MTQETRPNLINGFDTELPDGGQNTAADVRGQLTNIADSAFILDTDTSDTITEGSNNLFTSISEKTTWNNKLDDITGLLTDGSNITITGTGTSGDPYEISASAPVTSVNGDTGTVVLNTDDISEGSTNLYFSTERAQDSVGAAFNNTLVYNDGSNSMGRAAITGDIEIDAGSNTANISLGAIIDGDVNAYAAIAHSKMAALTANRVMLTDGAGFSSASSVTNTTLGYLDATSSIQSQLNGKQGTLTLTTTGSSGAATLVGTTLNIPQYSGGGSTGFNSLTTGTNTTATMTVGTGASITTSGSGTISATSAPLSGISGLGTNVGTFLGTPSSANLAAAVTDETGSGSLVFSNSPTLVTPTLGVASATSLSLTNDLTVANGGTGVSTLTGIVKGNGTSAFSAATAGTDYVSPTGTETLTNKRINPRIGTTTSSSTPTPNANTDDMYTITALAAGATFGAPTGTPVNGQALVIRVKDNGTARSLAYNAIYRAVGVTLPTTTVINKTLYLYMIYNSADTKWDVTGLSQEA